jgi:hypothetical protein
LATHDEKIIPSFKRIYHIPALMLAIQQQQKWLDRAICTISGLWFGD